MDHFQSTSTPQPSTSELPEVTPNVNKEKFSEHEEAILPPELCLNCSHNCKVQIFSYLFVVIFKVYSQILMPFLILVQLGLCPEASNHLKDMKDKLIAISNDIIDNSDNLSSDEFEKLRQERFAYLSEPFSAFS